MTVVEAEPGRRPRWTGRVGVVLVLVAAGMLFAASAHTARGTQLRADRSDAVSLLEAERGRVAELDARQTALKAEVDGLVEQASAGGGAAGEGLKRQTAALGLPAGVRAVQGPGLEITLDDAPRTSRVPDGVRPDDLVVHQQDVQAVVNAMWAGGAEAMMLQDQRVISTSAVRCVGNTLILQGRVYSPPYRITAVGDVSGMRDALGASPEVTIYRQYVDALGLGYAVQEKDAFRLPAYDGPLTLEHARSVDDDAKAAPATPGPAATPTEKETGS